MAKQTVHQIPLTPAERAFVVALLDAAKSEERAASIAAVVKAWPEEDGMAEIVLIDDDRKVVRGLLQRDRDRRRSDSRQSRRQLPQVDPYEHEDYVFNVGNASLTGKEILNLMLAFDDYELDIMTARRILAPSVNSDSLDFFGLQRAGEPVMHAYLRKIAVAGVYVDDKSAQPPYYVNVATARRACAEWEKAGICKLIREPAGGRRQYDRVYIDWRDDMWLPPKARRPIKVRSQPLQDVDDEALREMA